MKRGDFVKLIVGLGNPGDNYKNTRHNIGFIVLDNFAKVKNVTIDKEKFNGLYGQLFIEGEKVILLKPLSYMNLSGSVVRKYVNYFGIDIDDILYILEKFISDKAKKEVSVVFPLSSYSDEYRYTYVSMQDIREDGIQSIYLNNDL